MRAKVRASSASPVNHFFQRGSLAFAGKEPGEWDMSYFTVYGSFVHFSSNLQGADERSQLGSDFSRLPLVASYHSRRISLFHLKNRRTFTLFTTSLWQMLPNSFEHSFSLSPRPLLSLCSFILTEGFVLV